MPELIDPRQQRFCQLIVEGYHQTQAYEKAGYAKNKGNASVLRRRADVKSRIQELTHLKNGRDKQGIDQFLLMNNLNVTTLLAQMLQTIREARDVGQFKAALDGYKDLGRELFCLFDSQKKALGKAQQELKRRNLLDHGIQLPLLERARSLESLGATLQGITFNSSEAVEVGYTTDGESDSE